MNPKTLSSLLAIALFGLGIYAYQQRSQIADLQSQIADLQTVLVTLEQEPTAPPPTLAPAPAKPTPIAAAKPTPAEATAPADQDAINERQRVIRDFSASMLDNPQMNEMMQASQKASLEIMYKDLLDAYDFTPEERSHFMDMLMARQMFRVETSMKMMGGASSPEEMKLLGEEMKEYDQQVKAEIDTFLNSETDSNEFEFYEKTIAERMSLSGFKSSIAQAGKPIAPATERQLLEIMADQKANYTFQSDFADETNYDMSPNRFSEENINAFETDLGELHNIIAEEAQAILDPEQLTALVQSLQGMRDMQLSQLRMAANMFSQKPKG